MKPALRTLFLLVAVCMLVPSIVMAQSKVKLETSMGDMVIEMDDKEAPITVANFLQYVEAGFYDGTVFHRVIPGFVIQGGGFLPEFQRPRVIGVDQSPIQNEADNGLKNLHYSLSMARTGDPHSATSQFFINLTDNAFLDFSSKDQRGWGYAVFGRVVEGQSVVDKIGGVRTANKQPYQNVPVEDVAIIKASVVE